MAYNVEKFTFRPEVGMTCVKVTNEGTGKFCNFMVISAKDGISVSVRSPTPGFPRPTEMTEQEVAEELPEMNKALVEAFKSGKASHHPARSPRHWRGLPRSGTPSGDWSSSCGGGAGRVRATGKYGVCNVFGSCASR